MMHGSRVHVLLLVLLFILRVSRSFFIPSRPYSTVANRSVSSSQSSNNVHNATADCGNYAVMRKTVWQCQRRIFQLAQHGYMWSSHGSQRNSRNNRNATNRNNTLRDALDSLNHVCQIHDRSQTCLEESGITDFCRTTTGYRFIEIDFQFICHRRQRDENLIHSLQCLQETRLLAMLYFHIAQRCRGFGILDDIMKRNKNAYFYILGVSPYWDRANIPLLYCLPRSVISTCIRDIVEDQCGTMTADLAQTYMLYLQGRFDKAMQSAGLDSNICAYDIGSAMVSSRPSLPSDPTKLGISTLLEITAPGTALDTVWGKFLLWYLHRLPAEELCDTENADIAYQGCLMSSEDRSEKSNFNILQFAHRMMPRPYRGAQCSRLEQFAACWNLLQEICGSKVQGLELLATLLVKGCKIQSEMDTIGCHWQDMLLPHYIQASRVTVWPLDRQCMEDPMYLEKTEYATFNDVMDDLDTVISMLQPGLEEISMKCGSQPAERLRLLLNKLRYLQRDAVNYMSSLVNSKNLTQHS